MIGTFFIFLCVVATLCDSAALDSPFKCKIEDESCQIKQIHNFIQENSKEGGIVQLDPYNVTNLSLNIPELIEANFIEGTVKGLKDCVVTAFKPNYKSGRTIIEATCEHITIKGRYKFSSNSPALQTLLGANSIHGDGNAKIKLDKIYFKVTLLYKVVERDGEIYIVFKGKKVVLNDLQIGKATFHMDKVFLGKEESSAKVVQFLNDNSPLIISTFGRPLANKAMLIGMEQVGQVFTSTPVKNFLIDDMKPYVH